MTPRTKTFIFLLVNFIAIVFVAVIARADEVDIGVEIIWMGSIESEHSYQCKPNCLEQKNGGSGMQIDIGPFGIGEARFTNSFGNPGWMRYIVPARYRLENRYVRAEVELLIAEVHGYEDVVTVPWPKFELGVNPLFMLTDEIYINYNALIFPAIMGNHETITICWWSIGIYQRF